MLNFFLIDFPFSWQSYSSSNKFWASKAIKHDHCGSYRAPPLCRHLLRDRNFRILTVRGLVNVRYFDELWWECWYNRGFVEWFSEIKLCSPSDAGFPFAKFPTKVQYKWIAVSKEGSFGHRSKKVSGHYNGFACLLLLCCNSIPKYMVHLSIYGLNFSCLPRLHLPRRHCSQVLRYPKY